MSSAFVEFTQLRVSTIQYFDAKLSYPSIDGAMHPPTQRCCQTRSWRRSKLGEAKEGVALKKVRKKRLRQ